MLAKTYGPKFSSFPCFLQPKLNGVRALYQKGTFQSREEKVWKPKILAHIREELEVLNLGDLILDGELYVHGWRLQKINGAIAVKRVEPTEETLKVEYHVFDVVDNKQSFFDRFWPVYNNLPDMKYVKFVITHLTHSDDDVKSWFEHYVSSGYEGVMLRTDTPYEFGVTPHGTEKRSKSLWKYKSWSDGEYICVGATKGDGKAAIGIGALVLTTTRLDQYPENLPIMAQHFNVGGGFSDEDRIEFHKNPPIGKLIRVRYPYLSDEGIPQCPQFEAVIG